jgi:hypothetical protein
MTKKTEAKCNGSMLTVGFHNANPPLIWRFDLERNHSFTLALQGEDSDWELGVTSPKGDFYPVVHFAAREDAEEAFGKVEKALSVKKAAKSVLAKAFSILLGVIILIGLGFGLFVFIMSHKFGGAQTAQTMTGPAPADIREGIPLPADDVLKPPPR